MRIRYGPRFTVGRDVFRLAYCLVTLSLITGIRAPAAATAAQEVGADADLQTVANFMLPAESMTLFIVDACRSAYKTKLSRTPGDAELEKSIPGVHERMVSAASEHCKREVPRAVLERQEQIKADWRQSTSQADLKRFADLFREEVTQANTLRIDIRDGEMATDAVRRLPSLPSSQQQHFETKQKVLAATPAGAKLLNRIAAYQDKLKRDDEQGTWFVPIIKAAMKDGERAANLYAREKGFTDPYPDE